ncbi:MAG: type III-B CRISPR module-associated Cmr3 family protein [Bacillota bacterium]
MIEKTIKISLKPVESYFFGGENAFGYQGDDTSYYLRSNVLPQQTAILGMLKKIVLEVTVAIKPDWDYDESQKDKIRDLIGEIPKFDTGYFGCGKIYSISPLFLLNSGEVYLKMPFDGLLSKETYIPATAGFIKGAEIKKLGDDKKIPFIYPEGVDAKTYVKDAWINVGDGSIIEQQEIFEYENRVGIRKPRSRGFVAEDGYFEMDYVNIKNSFELAFYAELDKEIAEKLIESQQVVCTLGAERSTFRARIEPADDSFKDISNSFRKVVSPLYHSERDPKRIILLSDAYYPDYERRPWYMGFTRTTDFRYICMTDYGRKYDKPGGYEELRFEKPQKLITMLSRGSVMYIGQEASDTFSCIDKNEAFYKCGYNHYIIL